MSKSYVTADWHFGHKNITKYRPQFATPEEHDEHILEGYRKLITKRDTVYFLGDICFNMEAVEKIKDLFGYKILVLGNHDLEKGAYDLRTLWDAFDKVISVKSKKGCWLTHIPIHPEEMRGKFNIHGHTHNHVIQDPRYANVCLENTNYLPVDMRDVIETMKRGEIYGNIQMQ